MKSKLLILFIFFLTPFITSASHVVGGSLTYEQLGASTYKIILKVYRDCGPTSAALDNSVVIEVKRADGTAFVPSKNITIPLGTKTKLNPFVDTCVIKQNICVEEGIYTKIVNNFPPQAGGYHLFWQRCCRNASILNIVTPDFAGESFYTFIPDNNSIISNSSPSWINSPPTFICQSQPINFNHGATDPDGDSLSYKFYAPYLGCYNPAPASSPNCGGIDYPTFPANIATFNSVVWKPGYSASNPLGGAGLTLSSTGFLNGTPPAIGQYVMGIKCEEWRNGVKIGEIVRDFQFNVVNCPPPSNANFNTTGYCTGLTVKFNNTTVPVSNTYFWNFGVTSTFADTSHAVSPTYTYPAIGTYTVTLISNKGTPCADTSIQVVSVPLINAAFTSPTSTCTGLAVNFNDASTVSDSSFITNWDWNFGNGNTSTLQNPSNIYNTAGTFNVTLIVTTKEGCKDTIINPITILTYSNAAFNTIGYCKGLTVTFNNTSTPASANYFWNFGVGSTLADTSHAANPTYTYPAIGTYTVTLITNKGTPCADTALLVMSVPVIKAEFTSNTPSCKDFLVNFTDASVISNASSITNWDWNFGGGNTSTLQNPTFTFNTSGTFNVTLIVTTIDGCKDTITHPVIIHPLTSSGFNSSGYCQGLTVTFTNTSTPITNSYFWDFGIGSTLADTSNAVNPIYTFPALGTYTVTLISNKGTPCADTIIQVINVPIINAEFTSTAPACKDFLVNFTNASIGGFSLITNWDWTFGNGNTSTLQHPSATYTASGTFNVTLIVTTSEGCKDTITHPIIIQPLPVAAAGNDLLICNNNPTATLNGSVLNATGGIWMGSGTFNPGNTTVNANYTSTPAAVLAGKDTLYLVTTGNGACPADTDTVIITFYNGPTINAGGNTLIVCKDTTSIPITASYTTPATGILWTTSGTGYFGDSSKVITTYHPSVADINAGTITLHAATTGNGICFPALDSIAITFTTVPFVNITSTDSVCTPNSTPITATSTTGSGIWSSSGTGTFLPSNAVLNGFYNSSTSDNMAGAVQLIFTSTNNGVCKAKHDTINIILNPKPIAIYSRIPTCALAPLTFTNGSTISSGTIVNWNWNFGDNSPIDNTKSPTHTFNPGGIYNVTLIATSNKGCSDTLQQNVIIYHNPIANFEPVGKCKLDGTFFYDSSSVIGSSITSWNWSFGDNTNSTSQNPSHFYSSNGNQTTTLIVQSAQGCKDTVSQTITIIDSPNANFSANPTIANVNQNVSFTDLSSGSPINWFWDFGDSKSDSTSTTKNPNHYYSKGGYYQVCLVITDMNGCADTACRQEIVALPPDIPTGFSPNGDGVNDIFYVYGGPFKNITFNIYNNWGELIFTSTSQKVGWDGKRNGVDQPLGVYVYTVTGTTELGEIQTLSGDVTLLR